MRQFNAKVVEEFAWKADRKGFFKEWQQLSSSIKENKGMLLCKASEEAYNQLKLQGSE